MLIRRANDNDIPFLNKLLYQVAAVHHAIRPDLFRSGAKKYTDAQMKEILLDDETPVFLAEDGGEKLGYAFCLFQRHRNDGALNDFDALYIDDLCVDEAARGKHVGTALFDFVRRFAQENGCRCVTLNVWTGNDSARAFYDKRGMKPQKTMLELQLGVRSEELQ